VLAQPQTLRAAARATVSILCKQFVHTVVSLKSGGASFEVTSCQGLPSGAAAVTVNAEQQ
jgi:hypothetical protein